MSEQELRFGPGDRMREVEERMREIEKRPEYRQACINTRGGGDVFRELIKLGVPKEEVEPFVFASLEKFIRQGYGIATLYSIARSGGVVGGPRAGKLFVAVKMSMLREGKNRETPGEKKRREDKELEEMLAQYD